MRIPRASECEVPVKDRRNDNRYYKDDGKCHETIRDD